MIVSTPPLVVVLVLVQELYIRPRRQKPIEVTGVADLSSHAVVLETDGSFSVLSATRGTDSCLVR